MNSSTKNAYLFKPRRYDKKNNKIGFASEVILNVGADSYINSLAKRISAKGNEKKTLECSKISAFESVPESIIKELGSEYCENPEGYAIILDKEIKIYAQSRQGIIFALSTIEQLIDYDGLYEGFLYDYPDRPVRGYKLFTPGKDCIDDFKRVVDMLVYYKYNTIMIEIGGAMEYKRRPEINKAWEKYAAQFVGHSGLTKEIQVRTYPWKKNSTHVDNGGASFISQETMRELIEYCRQRGLDVIPEVPTMSHSDYILAAYPHLNERIEDKHPDTYCPSNPETYEVVFDIIDEVIEVFNPTYVNICHDELYSVAICDRCKGKSPVDLYVNDINKINRYIRAKGPRTVIWAEKLLKAMAPYGPVGGSGTGDWRVPPLYECAGKIDKDVMMMNWYWMLCDISFDDVYYKNGYEMYYGNLDTSRLDDYRLRMKKGALGGFLSNWGSLKEEYMQRNVQTFSIVFNALCFWSSEYDTPMSAEYFEYVQDELYRRYCASLGGDCIEIVHKTDMSIEYKRFYDGIFILDEDYLLGNYILSYIDGTTAKLPVKYGYNITNCKVLPDVENAGTKEVLGASHPIVIDGEVCYKTSYKNPYPDKKICGICYEPVKNMQCDTELISVEFKKSRANGEMAKQTIDENAFSVEFDAGEE